MTRHQRRIYGDGVHRVSDFLVRMDGNRCTAFVGPTGDYAIEKLFKSGWREVRTTSHATIYRRAREKTIRAGRKIRAINYNEED